MTISQRQPNSTTPDYVLIVGGCNSEYILQLPQELKIGQKNLAQSDWLIGGGGINQTLRLLKTDFSPVPVPILPLGHDDLGLRIREHLLAEYHLARAPQIVIDYLESEQFFVPNLSTRLSTIIIHGGERTILAEQMKGETDFYKHLQDGIEALSPSIEPNLKALTIGDIQADDPNNHPSYPGQCTQYLLNRFADKCLILANPGQAQLHLEPVFWHKNFPQLDLLQLNIREARQLVTQTKNLAVPSLTQLIDRFYEYQVNTIITCDHYGVLGLYVQEPNQIIFAPPIKLSHTVDSTGAGDAFGAGLVSSLSFSDFSLEDFKQGIDEARVWAAYACCHVGGAANCPTSQEVKVFQEQMLKVSEEVLVLDRQSIKTVLGILERIYF